MPAVHRPPPPDRHTPGGELTLTAVAHVPRRRLVTIEPDASVHMAARLMRAADVSALVVGTPGGLVSVVTERDVVRAVAEGLAPATPVASIATPDPAVVEASASLLVAATAMMELGVRHLVVVEGSRAVGLISIRDVLAMLLRPAAIGLATERRS
jgi:CBS domain-containing protein